jgi:predicted ATP-grasp superfamily ATP-dependent carboligase
MRSLGPLGVPLYGVGFSPKEPAMRSRYCRASITAQFSDQDPQALLEALVELSSRLGQRAVLIPTSDETSLVVAEHADTLRPHFLFQDTPAVTVRRLASKREMFELATQHAVPTPYTLFPRSVDDVERYAESGSFPVMLKGIFGNRLQMRTRKKMVTVANRQELLRMYVQLEDPESPNLMIQELIPGGDDQVFIFNGYFNRESACLVGFTGYKIRQYPVHVGCASLGECRWVPEVADVTTRFMRAVGYQGILEIGYRLDPLDGQ